MPQIDFTQSLLDITFWALSPTKQQAFIHQLATRHISRAAEADESVRFGDDYADEFFQLLEQHKVRPMRESVRNDIRGLARVIVRDEKVQRSRGTVTPHVAE